MAETTAGHHADPSEPEPHPPKGHPKLDPLPDTADKLNEEAVARFNTTQNSEKRNARSAGLFIAGLVIVAALWAWDPVTWWKSQDAPPTPSQAGAPTAPPAPRAPAAVFCGPGRIGVSGQCVPKDASTPVQPAAAPTPAASPSPGTAAQEAHILYTCSKKETTSDLQLVRSGFQVRFVIARPCTYAFKVLRGEVRVAYTDGTFKDFGLTTCPRGKDSDAECAASWKKTPRTMVSLTSSSVIDITLDPL